MSINLDNVKAITHNNKDVIKIEDSNGNTIWTKPSQDRYIYNSTSKLALADNTFSTTPFSISMYGNGVWSDGTNTYYTNNGNSYIIDFNNGTATAKTWTTNIPQYGYQICKMNGYIYNIRKSSSVSQFYIYEKELDSWGGLTPPQGLPTNFTGADIVEWNNNYYHIRERAVYKITVDQYGSITISNIGSFNSSFNNSVSGRYFWSPDGIHLYANYSGYSYEITDIENQTYTTKAWSGDIYYPNGSIIFNYNGKVLYCNNAAAKFYELDMSTSTWTDITNQFSNLPATSTLTDVWQFYDENGFLTLSRRPLAR